MKAYTFLTSMSHLLINPNQLRHFGTIVQDNPYSNDNITYIDTNIPDNNKRLYIPLTSQGINILFETQIPTQQELDDCPHVNLTSDTEWNPIEVRLSNASKKHSTSLWITMFCPNYFMLSYKYFYPKDFFTWRGPHIFRICI